MNIKVVKEYKLKGERNNRPRQPIIWNDKIYLIFVYDKKGFVESSIHCLEIDTFNIVWEFKHNHVINNILFGRDATLLVSCMDGNILCFNPNNGQKIWGFKTNESNIGCLSNEFDGKIVFSGIQARATSTWCLETEKGNILWVKSNQGHSYTAVLTEDLVFNCIGNSIYCLNIIDGCILWTQTEPRTYLLSSIAFDSVIIASGHGVLNFYNLTTGYLLQSIETGKQSAINKMIRDGENIYFGDEKGYFYCYEISFLENNLSVNLRWVVDTNGAVESYPTIKEDKILIINNAKKLIALNKETGELVIEKKIKGEGYNSGVTAKDNNLFFSCGGGHLYHCED